MSRRFVSFPLSSRFTIAADAPRSARRVRMLSGTSDIRRELLDRGGSFAVATFGTKVWRATDAWPWPTIDPEALTELLGGHLPGLDIVAAAAPRQRGRHRLSLLCRHDGADVIVKIGDTGDGLENEAATLALLDRDPLPCIATPRLLASGSIESVAFVATDALGLSGQRPALDEPLRTFEDDVAQRLRALPRPANAEPDAVPIHGDLAPWNLRRTAHGLALFDWESAGWGRPGSDIDHYRRTCAGLR